MKHNIPVAIIGMGCFFPKSSGLKEYWRLLYNGVDAITDIPTTHWSTEDYYDKDPGKPDHVYCKRGGFLDPISFDPTEFAIPPSSLEAIDTAQLLGLVVAKKTMEDAGYGDGRAFNRDKTSVILGATGTQELVIPLGARLGHPKWRRALKDAGIADEKIEEIIERISDSYVSWQENSFPGLLGNVIAGRICNRLDLGGTNCVVDAACASSMSAIHLAVMELYSGRSDMVITGGVDALNDIFMHMCFSKTQTLSPTGDARPFSKDADGTVLGEGIGMLALKRLADAEKDGNRIYAIIKGIGSSSDGKSQSIYAPRKEGQTKALRKAYENADVDPSTMELIEAHGTGTRVGDIVEFQSLTQFFCERYRSNSKCALGSVKSMIGHTKAAAGAAGLIKSALALYHKVLPPTLKANEPNPNLNIDKSPFYLNTETRPWFSINRHPRRAGVSAFGFGGSNFHLVLEEYLQNKQEISWDGSIEIVALSASSRHELAKRVRSFNADIDKGLSYGELSINAAKTRTAFSSSDQHRLLFVLEQSLDQSIDSAVNLSGLLSIALDALESNKKYNTWHAKNIYYGGPEKPGKLAYVFPGQGSQYVGMGRDLVCMFPEAFEALERANEKFEHPKSLSDIIYPYPAPTETIKKNQEEVLRETDIAQPAIAAVSLSMMKILQRFGIKPDATCGHSFGELTALCAGGWIDVDTFIDLSISRGMLMAAAGRNTAQDTGTMLAVKAPLGEFSTLIKDAHSGVVLANRNAPDQGVLSGTVEAIALADNICNQKGFRTIKLPVSAAFHSSLVKDAHEPFAKILTNINMFPSDTPVFSNTTGTFYPRDPDAAKKLLGEQILRPVDFVSEIENMFDSGIRTFVEVGPKSVLTGLVKSILKDRDFQAIALDSSAGKRYGIADLAKTLCYLASMGYPIDLACWEQPPTETKKQMMSIPIGGANYRNPKSISKKRTTETKKRQQTNKMDEKTVDTNKHQPSTSVLNALKVVRDGLKSMQALQMETAQAHKKFLETQAEASRALQNMMENTQRLAEVSLGLKTDFKAPDLNLQSTFTKTSMPYETPTNITTAEDHASYAPEVQQIPKPDAIPPAPPGQPSAETAILDMGQSSKVQETIGNAILELVSRLTGYPEEMLGLDMDIETDLGIDSIKRVEILSALEEKIPDLPAISPDLMGRLKTLGQIVEYLSETPTSDVSQTKTETESSVSSTSSMNKNQESLHDFSYETLEYSPDLLASTVDRKVVSIVRDRNPAANAEYLSIPTGRKLYITDDNTGFPKAIADKFVSLNIDAVVVSNEMISGIIKGDEVLQNAAGLVIISESDPKNRRFLKDAFLLTKQVAPAILESASEGGALFATITRLDGAFGFKGRGVINPVQGGLAGLAKTASIEWNAVCCRAIDIAPDWKENRDLASAVVAELLNSNPSGPVEIGLGPDERLEFELESAPYPEGKIDLNPGDVVVITGGARGVTAASALALAKYAKPTLVLMGRSQQPAPEPEWLAAVNDESAVKKAILENEFVNLNASPMQIEQAYKKHTGNREIRKNLEKMRKAGATVLYYSVDVRDFDKVNSILDDVRSNHGPIAGVIHGAGSLEDRLIIDKSIEQFEKVFDTKVEGLNTLLEATKQDRLKYLVLFSSVTARIGNKGQVDYAMANEVLNKIAQQESTARPDCKVISINWGPWNGGMVCSALKRKFERNGIDLIPMDAGAMCMIHEMMGDKNYPTEVVVGANIIRGKEKLESHTLGHKQQSPQKNMAKLSLTLQREIDIDTYPILGAHILDGKPVVPFSLIAEWLGHGALHENPGLLLHGLDDMRLFNGIKFDRKKKTIKLMASKPRKKGSIFEVDVEIRNGFKNELEMIHSRATAILSDKLEHPPLFNISDHISPKAYARNIDEVYEKILFHGFELRGIKEIISYSSRGMVARISSAPPPAKWMTEPLRSKWIGDPLVLDSAFQMAIVWCFEEKGIVSLPSYSASYRQYQSNYPSDGVTVVLEVNRATEHKMMGEFTFLDRNEVVVASLTGYEAVMDASLSRAFKSRSAA